MANLTIGHAIYSNCRLHTPPPSRLHTVGKASSLRFLFRIPDAWDNLPASCRPLKDCKCSES